MSDNITREPYRNAWYRQLADAVKKHDEKIAEMTPHLVPNVEEGDNGKILIAGEDGAFDWGQPPEELPVITEGDEGKVLKVDEGVPKWLEDSDSEYLLITITRSGSGTPESPYVYTHDKDFSTIMEFGQKGKAIVLYNNSYYIPMMFSPNTGVAFTKANFLYGYSYSGDYKVLKSITLPSFTILSTEVKYIETVLNTSLPFKFVDGATLSQNDYNVLKMFCTNVVDGLIVYTKSGNDYAYYTNSTCTSTEMTFINIEKGLKATVGTDRVIHITNIPTAYVNYSTTEHVIGTWIDGSTLYEKTIQITTMPNDNTVSTPHGISNIDGSCIVEITGILRKGTNYATPLPRVHDNNLGQNIMVEVDATNIILYCRNGGDQSSFTSNYVTIRYTKLPTP